jgi:3-methyladenine DNA glycosylase/8-oxoguanine DNA glycosylase
MNSATSALPLPFDHVEAHAHLSRSDERLASLIAKVGSFHFKLDECDSVYESLLEAIMHQSIAGKAAQAIWARIKAFGSNGQCPTPAELLRVSEEDLRKAGLSRAKVASVRDLAQKTIDGVVPTLAEAEKMSDQELVDRLISVRGIGPWTVEMFLIFRLGRPDVLPIHDYGVQKGFALTYGKRKIPKPRELAKFGERWRPFRSVASWYMWRAVQLAGSSARKIKKAKAKIKVKLEVKPARKSKKKIATSRAAKKVAAKRITGKWSARK